MIMEKNNDLMAGKGEQGKWITVNGAHVFVEDGQSVEDAMKSKFSKGNEGKVKYDNWDDASKYLKSQKEKIANLEKEFSKASPEMRLNVELRLNQAKKDLSDFYDENDVDTLWLKDRKAKREAADTERLNKILQERNQNEDADFAKDTDYFGFGSLDALEKAHNAGYKSESKDSEVKTQKIHLQSIGEKNAVEASNIKVGDEMIWNFGYKEKVLDITPSKSGQSLTMKIKDMQSGNTLTRTIRAKSLVALTRLN